MKRLRSAFVLAALTIAGAALSTEALAQNILLTVDDSHPTNVTFTATGNDPATSNATHPFNDGIDLNDFFSTSIGTAYNVLAPSSTTLTTSVDSTPFFNESHEDDLFHTGTDVDFNFFTLRSGAGNTENYHTAFPAFTGMASVDLSGDAAFLPAPGTTGGVYTGFEYADNPPVLIGEFVVVPEAGTGTFVLLGGALVLLARWCRAKMA